MSKYFCCPECGNRDLQMIKEESTQTVGKNYSGAQGCLGYLLMGPLGLLCGSCGHNQRTVSTSKSFWVCSKCGHKFRDLEESRKSIEKNFALFNIIKWLFIVIMALTGIMVIINIIMLFAGEREPVVIAGTVLSAAFSVGLYAFVKSLENSNLAELRKVKQTEEKMEQFCKADDSDDEDI